MSTVLTPPRPIVITIPDVEQTQEKDPDQPSCCVCGDTGVRLWHCEGGALLDNDCASYVCTEHMREYVGWCQINYHLCPGCHRKQITPRRRR